jgi:pyruvate/2-oxoglutarate dehydrogenase complex dihydrolipoamide acyltransferase (E2) component
VTLVAQDIPKIGLVMDAVKVVRWLKNVGDTVRLGEPLVEVETEKSIVEIEATASGRLAQILVQVDQQATVGDRIAWIESDQAQPAGDRVRSSPVAARHLRQPFRRRAIGERIAEAPVARKLAAGAALISAQLLDRTVQRVQLDDRANDHRRRCAGCARSLVPLSPMRRALARAMTRSNASIPQFTVERSVDWTVLQALRGEFPRGRPTAIRPDCR